MIESKVLIQMALSLAVLLSIIIVIRLTKRIIIRFGKRQNFHENRIFYVNKISTIMYTLVLLLLLSIIWGFDIQGLPIYFASFFGLVGIAFFATWSVLTNITASLIIFFSYKFRISDRIKIIDGDNSIAGRVRDMTMFTVVIETEDDTVVTYPNNLIIQKPVQLFSEA